jgi:hypothetical protein
MEFSTYVHYLAIETAWLDSLDKSLETPLVSFSISFARVGRSAQID